jgi:hypothetical protein
MPHVTYIEGLRTIDSHQVSWGFFIKLLDPVGFIGARTIGLDGLGLGWRGWVSHASFGSGKVQDNAEPDTYEQEQLREKEVRAWYCLIQSVVR